MDGEDYDDFLFSKAEIPLHETLYHLQYPWD
jgi:hypothetical protein